MAGVARGLGDQVQQHPPHRPGVDVVGVPRDSLRDGHVLAEVRDGSDDGLGLARDLVVEVEHLRERLVGLEAEVRLVVVLGRAPVALHHQVDPPALGGRRVLDETADAQRARAGREARLVVAEAVGGELDHVTLLRQEREQTGALVGNRGNLSGHGRDPSGGWTPSCIRRREHAPENRSSDGQFPSTRCGWRLASDVMHEYTRLYIDGAWVEPSGRGTLEVVDSTTEERFATIPAGDADDIDRAVAAAKAAFPDWSERTGAERGKLLQRVADALEARRDEIAAVIAHEVGMPKHQALTAQVGGGISGFAAAAELATTYRVRGARASRATGSSCASRSVSSGCITPWNYPLNQIGAKVAYALAAGCTVVLKPSEVAPVNAFILAEIMDEIGFPAAARAADRASWT